MILGGELISELWYFKGDVIDYLQRESSESVIIEFEGASRYSLLWTSTLDACLEGQI